MRDFTVMAKVKPINASHWEVLYFHLRIPAELDKWNWANAVLDALAVGHHPQLQAAKVSAIADGEPQWTTIPRSPAYRSQSIAARQTTHLPSVGQGRGRVVAAAKHSANAIRPSSAESSNPATLTSANEADQHGFPSRLKMGHDEATA